MQIDLPAYLERIALKEAPAADAEGLSVLQRAHRLAIPFENLDVALGRPISVRSEEVFAKLVGRRRGGYCFEQNRLFLDALETLGFDARPLLARVWLRSEGEVPPATHNLALVTIDGQDWIADPGFGGSYCPPMPLSDGETAEAPDGALFRLARDPLHGWMLSRNGRPDTTMTPDAPSGWQDQYSFDEARVFPADIELANHYVSTSPASPFTGTAMVNAPLPHGFAQLSGRDYKRVAAGERNAAEIADPRVYRLRLSMLFGITLSPDEVAALGLFER